MSGEACSLPSIARLRVLGRRKIHTMPVSLETTGGRQLASISKAYFGPTIVIAGFFTGGALAIRGGWRSARNSAIACGCLLAVIEGVGIGFQRMMAENTRLDVSTRGMCWTRMILMPRLVTTTTSSSGSTTIVCDARISASTLVLLLFEDGFDVASEWPSISPLPFWCFAFGGSSLISHGRLI